MGNDAFADVRIDALRSATLWSQPSRSFAPMRLMEHLRLFRDQPYIDLFGDNARG